MPFGKVRFWFFKLRPEPGLTHSSVVELLQERGGREI